MSEAEGYAHYQLGRELGEADAARDQANTAGERESQALSKLEDARRELEQVQAQLDSISVEQAGLIIQRNAAEEQARQAVAERDAATAQAARLAAMPSVVLARTWTPDETNGSTTTVRVKRSCNGCGASVGDVTAEEIENTIDGGGELDVRQDCVFCLRAALDVANKRLALLDVADQAFARITSGDLATPDEIRAAKTVMPREDFATFDGRARIIAAATRHQLGGGGGG